MANCLATVEDSPELQAVLGAPGPEPPVFKYKLKQYTTRDGTRVLMADLDKEVDGSFDAKEVPWIRF